MGARRELQQRSERDGAGDARRRHDGVCGPGRRGDDYGRGRHGRVLHAHRGRREPRHRRRPLRRLLLLRQPAGVRGRGGHRVPGRLHRGSRRRLHRRCRGPELPGHQDRGEGRQSGHHGAGVHGSGHRYPAAEEYWRHGGIRPARRRGHRYLHRHLRQHQLPARLAAPHRPGAEDVRQRCGDARPQQHLELHAGRHDRLGRQHHHLHPGRQLQGRPGARRRRRVLRHGHRPRRGQALRRLRLLRHHRGLRRRVVRRRLRRRERGGRYGHRRRLRHRGPGRRAHPVVLPRGHGHCGRGDRGRGR